MSEVGWKSKAGLDWIGTLPGLITVPGMSQFVLDSGNRLRQFRRGQAIHNNVHNTVIEVTLLEGREQRVSHLLLLLVTGAGKARTIFLLSIFQKTSDEGLVLKKVHVLPVVYLHYGQGLLCRLVSPPDDGCPGTIVLSCRQYLSHYSEKITLKGSPSHDIQRTCLWVLGCGTWSVFFSPGQDSGQASIFNSQSVISLTECQVLQCLLVRVLLGRLPEYGGEDPAGMGSVSNELLISCECE